MKFEKITEKDSHYNSLETKSTKELLSGIHQEDKVAVLAVGHVLDKIESLNNINGQAITETHKNYKENK